MHADQVATFEHYRDHADNHLGRATRQDVIAPPSKAHLKRLARVRPEITKAKNREISQLPETIRLHKQLIADLGGSRTIAPSHDGTLYNAKERGVFAYAAKEAVKPKETDPTFRERKRLYVATKRELAKMVYTEHQPSLLDIIEFGE